MFINYKNVPISINNHYLVCDDIQLSNDIELTPQYYVENAVAELESPSSMWKGILRIQYYLSNEDFLKQYIYSNEIEPISGNIAGLIFAQGYLSDYSINIEPNTPVKVNASISFFDQLTGTLISSPAIIQTGFVLRSSDIQIDNYQGYTENLLNNFTRANFSYSCQLTPSYEYVDTGNIPTRANNVFIQERTISTEITSDSVNFSLPISGERFGSTFTFINPNNHDLYETFSCSGLISSKNLSLNTDNPHFNTLKIIQHNVNKEGGIYNVAIGSGNLIIFSDIGFSPFISKDGTLNYVNSVWIGDTQVTGLSVLRLFSYDQITADIPFNIIDGTLTVNTNYGNYIWPNKLNFTYPEINVTGISCNTGSAGQLIYISGENFVRISDVLFGGITNSIFQAVTPEIISAVIPSNGLSGPISVISHDRNKSGQSNTFFYPPTISSISPTTGLWKDTININGHNFTGITGVYFNDTLAFSASISDNLILAQTPETGQPFPSGYIKLYGTGGYTQSVSVYNPELPIYSFTPLSGVPLSPIYIKTKIDTGYYFPYSGGYKVRICGDDIPFFVSGNTSTGVLTGLSPNDPSVESDYIYIYKTDGTSTSSSRSKYTTFGYPRIDNVVPEDVNQFQYTPVTLYGENLAYFFNNSTYVSISGGVSGDSQRYNTGQFTSSLDGSTLIINNIKVTGSTGFYDIFVKNTAGSYTFENGLNINAPVNQSQELIATYNNNGSLTDPTSLAIFSIDSSYNTYAALQANNSNDFTHYISYVPRLNQKLNIDLIKVNQDTTNVPNSFGYQNTAYVRMNSGIIVCYSGLSKSVYSGYFNGLGTTGAVVFPGTNGISGVNEIRIIASRCLGDHKYFLPITELEIY